MPNPADEILEFQCPKCAKRLKAGAHIAGRRVKCPKCSQEVRVPGVPAIGVGVPAHPTAEDAWLSLESPAIDDLPSRELAAAEVKAKKTAFRLQQHRLCSDVDEDLGASAVPIPAEPHSRRQSAEAAFNGSAEFVAQAGGDDAARDTAGEDDFALAPLDPVGKNRSSQQRTAADSGVQPGPKPSIFDDDLPELAQLETRSPAKLLPVPTDGLGDLDALIPELDDSSLATGSFGKDTLPPLLGEPVATDHEYRIACKVCGTGQYVRLSAKGMKIKCPDCFSDFRVPGPPSGWSPTKKKLELSKEDMPLEATTALQEAQSLEARKTRTAAMLAKAQKEVSDEDLERLYDGEFDTAGFLRRTFGFLTDPVAVSFVIGYGIVFACVFALAQYGLNNSDSGFGRGALLLGMIGAPIIGILFGLPMLSSALALLESVANRQKKVVDWPGFDMFDNFGDLMAIAGALAGASLPGFMIGLWLGGEGDMAGRIQLTWLMLSTLLLFPIFLLSMLDNGSLFQPISESVLASLKKAAEAWGGYYLKTSIAFAMTILLWYVLLGDGKSPLLAGLAGFLLAPLVFFTFQQLGALADSIGEHLSFEFEPKSEEDDSEEKVEVVNQP